MIDPSYMPSVSYTLGYMPPKKQIPDLSLLCRTPRAALLVDNLRKIYGQQFDNAPRWSAERIPADLGMFIREHLNKALGEEGASYQYTAIDRVQEALDNLQLVKNFYESARAK